MYSMSMFLTLFFLIIFYFPGIERTDRNDLIQNAGADATGDLHEPTSVSEINMVMDWSFIFQSVKLDSIWLRESQLY